jgi:hypothetical protein
MHPAGLAQHPAGFRAFGAFEKPFPVVRLRGLPFNAGELDIFEFFQVRCPAAGRLCCFLATPRTRRRVAAAAASAPPPPPPPQARRRAAAGLPLGRLGSAAARWAGGGRKS